MGAQAGLCLAQGSEFLSEFNRAVWEHSPALKTQILALSSSFPLHLVTSV